MGAAILLLHFSNDIVRVLLRAVASRRYSRLSPHNEPARREVALASLETMAPATILNEDWLSFAHNPRLQIGRYRTCQFVNVAALDYSYLGWLCDTALTDQAERP